MSSNNIEDKINNQLHTYVALDVEATGISPNKSRIIEIGAIKVKDGVEVERFHSLINPLVPLSEDIEKLTGITNDMVKKVPKAREVLKEFLYFCGDYYWLGHSINSDFGYIKAELMKNDMLPNRFLKYGYDTLAISRMVLPELEKKSLESMCAYYSIKNDNQHRALDDVKATIDLFNNLKNDFYLTTEISMDSITTASLGLSFSSVFALLISKAISSPS